MVASATTRGRDFLQSLMPGYEADGFSVFINPPRRMLPSFMRGYQPDAIAIKEDSKIAIEIKRDAAQQGARIEEIRKLFGEHPEWELRLYYIPNLPDSEEIQAPAIPEIDTALAEADQLKRASHLGAALMVAWAALEAASRAVLPEYLARPQAANRLIEILASEGMVTPSEADNLRNTLRLRNAVSHGHFAVQITETAIDEVISVAMTIKELAKA